MQITGEMSKINIYSVSVVFAVLFIFIVLELVRRNKLLEKYSMMWLVFSVVIILLASSPYAIIRLAQQLDIKYAPSLLFLLGVIFLIVYTLHITTVLSIQSERIVRLSQEIALIKQKQSEIVRREI